jgi:oligoendopeptidase F
MKTTPKMPAPQRTTKQAAKSTDDPQEEIRRRAYELYEQRGRENGRDLEHWLQAESEVAQKKAETVAT